MPEHPPEKKLPPGDDVEGVRTALRSLVRLLAGAVAKRLGSVRESPSPRLRGARGPRGR